MKNKEKIKFNKNQWKMRSTFAIIKRISPNQKPGTTKERGYRMKRLAASALCLLLVFGAAACNSAPQLSGKSADEIFSIARERTRGLSSYDIQSTITMTQPEVKGDSSSDRITVTLKKGTRLVKEQSAVRQAHLSSSSDIFGENGVINTYYHNGTRYSDALGMKIKAAMTNEEILAQATVDLDFLTPAREAFGDLTLKQNGEDYELSFAPDSKTFEPYIKLLNQITGSEEGDSGTVYTNISGVLTVNKDGYFSKLSVTLKNETDTIQIETVNNNPGAKLTIDMPNANEYQQQ